MGWLFQRFCGGHRAGYSSHHAHRHAASGGLHMSRDPLRSIGNPNGGPRSLGQPTGGPWVGGIRRDEAKLKGNEPRHRASRNWRRLPLLSSPLLPRLSRIVPDRCVGNFARRFHRKAVRGGPGHFDQELALSLHPLLHSRIRIGCLLKVQASQFADVLILRLTTVRGGRANGCLHSGPP